MSIGGNVRSYITLIHYHIHPPPPTLPQAHGLDSGPFEPIQPKPVSPEAGSDLGGDKCRPGKCHAFSHVMQAAMCRLHRIEAMLQTRAVGDLDVQSGPCVDFQHHGAVRTIEHDIDTLIAQTRHFVTFSRQLEQILPTGYRHAGDMVVGVRMRIHHRVTGHGPEGLAGGNIDAHPNGALGRRA